MLTVALNDPIGSSGTLQPVNLSSIKMGGGGGQPNFCVCPGKKSQNTHTQKLTKVHMEF